MRRFVKPVIVHQETTNTIQSVKRALVEQNTERISFSDIVGDIGWMIGLMGIRVILKARGKR